MVVRHHVSPHHYPSLVRRWRAVARKAKLRLQPLLQVGADQLYYLQTPALAEAGGLYLSAGIHGDEPAGTEGLLAWAESHVHHLRQLPLLIFPCLNPWGLVQNMRSDVGGRDLNRCFQGRLPEIRAIKRVVGKRRFSACVHLHEDFDGEGLYLYELARGVGWGEALLDAARPILATDPRKKVDRWRAKDGLVRRRIRRSDFKKLGEPEAVWLFFEHTDRALTIETPSEFDLERRVAAQVSVLNEIARRALAESQ